MRSEVKEPRGLVSEAEGVPRGRLDRGRPEAGRRGTPGLLEKAREARVLRALPLAGFDFIGLCVCVFLLSKQIVLLISI